LIALLVNVKYYCEYFIKFKDTWDLHYNEKELTVSFTPHTATEINETVRETYLKSSHFIAAFNKVSS